MARSLFNFVLRIWAVAQLATVFASAQAQAPSLWTPSGIGGGGALFAPTFSPYVKNEMSLFCDMGEQFCTKDMGVTWTITPFNALVSSGTTNHLQYGASDQDVFAITFSGLQTPVMSHDGGKSYGPIPNDPTSGNAYTFIVNRQNPKQMLVSSWSTLYSSRDGGVTWFIADFDDSSSGLLFSGAVFTGSQVIVCDQHGLLVSLNGGGMFHPLAISGIPASEGIVQFAYGQSAKGGLRLMVVTNPLSAVYEGMGGSSLVNFANAYTLKWGDRSWTQITKGIPAGTLPFFVGMAQNDPNTAYLAGGSSSGMETVVKTTDGGQTWKSVFKTTGNANVITGWSGWLGDKGGWWWGGYALGFAVSPNNSSDLAITDYGFCHVSTNGGTSWRQVYESPQTENPAGANTPMGKAYATNGLENTACYCMAWIDASHIWAGYGDIGAARSTTTGKTWSFDYSGLDLNSTYQLLVAPSGAIYAATSSVHEMYETTNVTDGSIDSGTGNVSASTDGGQNWQAVGNLGLPVVALSFDPNNPKRLYASVVNSHAGGIYRCDDATKGPAASWTPISAPPRTQGHPNSIAVLNDGTLVCSYSARLTAGFTDSSGVFASKDAGNTWSDLSDANMHWWTRDLVIDPTDPKQNTWYVGVFGGWGGASNNRGGLYRSTDRGATWTNVLPVSRVRSCTTNPKNGKQVFVTTETEGLWFTNDATDPDPMFEQVDSYPFMSPGRIYYNPYKAGEVWVASVGNGLRVGLMASQAHP